MNLFWKKLAAAGFLLFLALWAAGFARSLGLDKAELLTLTGPSLPGPFLSGPSYEEFRSRRATANNLAQIGLAKMPLPLVLEKADVNKIVVYDKTAQLASGTTTFAEDEKVIRKAIAGHQAVVFSEKAGGISPERSLVLGISVPPARFDALLDQLSRVGHLESIQVVQQDRTGEFRKLLAQRQSLQKHLEAILRLRGSAAKSVDETLKLEAKILEVEKENQELGVRLGDLLGKEPFYNLFLTLEESPPGGRHDRRATLAQRMGTAFVWALGWWLVAALGAGLVLGAYASVRTLRQTKQAAVAPGH